MTTAPFTPDRERFRTLVAEIAAQAKATLPEANGRVDKAVALVLQGDVDLLPDGTARVYSQRDGITSYRVVNGTCDCADYARAPSQWCKHRIAAGILTRVQARLPQAPPVEWPPDEELLPPAQSPPVETETPVSQPPGQPAPALPEAPASVNVRLTIQGREVQWTLRDVDEDRLAARLHALLARYPLPQASPQASPAPPLSPQQHNAAAMPQAVDFCKVHNVPMKLNEKDGRQWRSHWSDDEQRWCKGK